MITALLLGSQASHAAGDPKRGAGEFAQDCAVCHSAIAGKNKVGPSLFAVVGRKAGSMTDFAYSEAMKQSAIEWAPEKLDAFITNPKQLVPGNKMPFGGISEEKEREDIIAYLNTLH
ncbi:MAG: c-type cytochrome [Thiobacillus sp.]